MTGRRRTARCSSRPGSGCGRNGIRAPARRDWQRSVSREVDAVRRSVGVCDVSTLGKIDIQGADAAAFLDRVYTNKFSTLAVGRRATA